MGGCTDPNRGHLSLHCGGREKGLNTALWVHIVADVFSCLTADQCCLLPGITIEEAVNEKNLSARGIFKYDAIGVVFKDDFSYHLRFQSYSVISPVDAFEHIGKRNEWNQRTWFSGW